MRIIVTGGAGFVGSNLVDKLVDMGCKEVVIVDNLATGSMKNVNVDAHFEEFDIRSDWHSNDKLSSFNPDFIFHIAALARIQPSFKRPAEVLSANCSGTVQMLEYARLKKSMVVYAGSSSFYFDPQANPYAHSKWIGEEHCKMYNKVFGVPVAIARFFNVYGPRHVRDGDNANVLGIFERQRMANQSLTITGTGEQRRDFTHVDDICSGLIAMTKSSWNGDIFNLGRSSNYSINEIANMFKPKDIQYLPARPGEAKDTLANIDESRSKLFWEPRKNISDHISEFLKNIGVS